MRTISRQVNDLNPGKLALLGEISRAYRTEKKHWLGVFRQADTRHLIKQARKVRDAAVKDKYVPASGLQARMWKLALSDAADTWDKHWKALFVEVRSKLSKHSLLKNEEAQVTAGRAGLPNRRKPDGHSKSETQQKWSHSNFYRMTMVITFFGTV
jgi:hypothetical protein